MYMENKHIFYVKLKQKATKRKQALPNKLVCVQSQT